MQIQLDFPLGTRIRMRHPTHNTQQEAVVCAYYAKDDGLYVRFTGASSVYGLAQSYVNDPLCFRVIRRGNGRD